MRISVLTIGDELLEGVISNGNAKWLGQELWQRGHCITQQISVGDSPSLIAEVFTRLAQTSDLLVISGGLGPTTDDVTIESIALALGETQTIDESQKSRLMDMGMNAERAEYQARKPKSALAHNNGAGFAPIIEGMVGHCRYFALPGVPREFYDGVNVHILPLINTTRRVFGAALSFINLGETALSERIKALSLPPQVECRYLADPPYTHLRLRAEDSFLVQQSERRIIEASADDFLTLYGEALTRSLHEKLVQLGLTVATAESCTAGQIAATLANLSGSSAFLKGGIIAYSNEVKIAELDVGVETIENFGAVSQACAREMARNVAQILKSDVGISVTGIAGPSGGSLDKPVGTVCFGWHIKERTICETKVFRGNRSSIRRATTVWSLHRCLELIGE